MLYEELRIKGLQIKIVRKKSLKNIYIRVNPPDGSITINAPAELQDVAIEAYFIKMLPEVVKAKDRMLEQERRAYGKLVSGEIHFLWGKPYTLQVVHEKTRRRIAIKDDKIIMTVRENVTHSAREDLLKDWYRREIKRALKTVVASCEKKTGIRAKKIIVRNMKTRWGTCNAATRRIFINLQLAKKPSECLEYVIIHELAHMREKGHTQEFYALVERCCPKWKEASQLLSFMPLTGMKQRKGDDPDAERYL